eukprot:6334279-Pyramimonas_sp.AAC.1
MLQQAAAPDKTDQSSMESLMQMVKAKESKSAGSLATGHGGQSSLGDSTSREASELLSKIKRDTKKRGKAGDIGAV